MASFRTSLWFFLAVNVDRSRTPQVESSMKETDCQLGTGHHQPSPPPSANPVFASSALPGFPGFPSSSPSCPASPAASATGSTWSKAYDRDGIFRIKRFLGGSILVLATFNGFFMILYLVNFIGKGDIRSTTNHKSPWKWTPAEALQRVRLVRHRNHEAIKFFSNRL